MINVAVVGSGYWGKNLVRNFDELGALHTICDLPARAPGRLASLGRGAALAVAGGPAEIVGWMCECGHQLDLQDGIAICNDCGKRYRRTGEEIEHFEMPLL